MNVDYKIGAIKSGKLEVGKDAKDLGGLGLV